MKVKNEREVAQSCPTLRDPMEPAAYQALLSMGFSRQEYWSGVPLPSLRRISITHLKIIYLAALGLSCGMQDIVP